MKKITCILVVLSFGITVSAASSKRWKNGGTSTGVSTVKFGTHDWLLWKGYLLAKDDIDLTWLNNQRHYAFFGTEAPDLGKSKLQKSFRNQVDGNYRDTSPCHCILYDDNGDMFQPFAADRVETEFAKAKAAIEDENWKLAAFYVGAMSHYIADLSQFMHLMGNGSRWNGGIGEDQDVHADYEKVFENRVNFQTKKLPLMEDYIGAATIMADNPRNIAIEVGLFTDTGGGTDQTPGEMYETILGYHEDGIHMKPEEWDQAFLDQSGKNINKAANAIAKLLRMLMDD
jgi:hypothetical protein